MPADDAAPLSRTPMPFAAIVKDRLLSAIAKGWGEKDMTSFLMPNGKTPD